MIWVAAGTEEGRRIAKALREKGHRILVSVTTEYGASLLRRELKGEIIIDQALDYGGMETVLKKFPITQIVDATHPYAEEVSKNLITLSEDHIIPYLRYERPSLRELIGKTEGKVQEGDVLWVKKTEEAIEALRKTSENLLLTTGSKTLEKYVEALETARIYARVLPVPKVMEHCKALGLPPGQILGIQGPFSKAFNRITLEEYKIRHLVTKDSGLTGGVPEKIQGALEAKAQIIVIERPAIVYPKVFSNMMDLLEEIR